MKSKFPYKVTVRSGTTMDEYEEIFISDVPFVFDEAQSSVARKQVFATYVAKPIKWQWSKHGNSERISDAEGTICICDCFLSQFVDSYVEAAMECKAAAVIVSQTPSIDAPDIPIIRVSRTAMIEIRSFQRATVLVEEIDATAGEKEHSSRTVKKTEQPKPKLSYVDAAKGATTTIPDSKHPTHTKSAVPKDKASGRSKPKDDRFDDSTEDKTTVFSITDEEYQFTALFNEKKGDSNWLARGLKKVSQVVGMEKKDPELVGIIKDEGWGLKSNFSAFRKAFDLIGRVTKSGCSEEFHNLSELVSLLQDVPVPMGRLRLAICAKLWMSTTSNTMKDPLLDAIISSLEKLDLSKNLITSLQAYEGHFPNRKKPHLIFREFFKHLVKDAYFLTNMTVSDVFWIKALALWEDVGLLDPMIDWEYWGYLRLKVDTRILINHFHDLKKMIGIDRVRTLSLFLQPSVPRFFDMAKTIYMLENESFVPEQQVGALMINFARNLVQKQIEEGCDSTKHWNQLLHVLSECCWNDTTKVGILRAFVKEARIKNCKAFTVYQTILVGAAECKISGFLFDLICEQLVRDLSQRQISPCVSDLTPLLNGPVGSRLLVHTDVKHSICRFLDSKIGFSSIPFGEKLLFLAALNLAGNLAEPAAIKDDFILASLYKALERHTFEDKLRQSVNASCDNPGIFSSPRSDPTLSDEVAKWIVASLSNDLFQNLGTVQNAILRLHEGQNGPFATSLLASLQKELTSHCTSIKKAALIYRGIFDEERRDFTANSFLNDVLLDSFEQWKPKTLTDIQNMGQTAEAWTIECLQNKVQGAKNALANCIAKIVRDWQLDFQTEDINLTELRHGAACSSTDIWGCLSSLGDFTLPSTSDIQSKIEERTELLLKIERSLAAPEHWKCSIAAVLNNYNCSEDPSSLYGDLFSRYSRLLNGESGQAALDPDLRPMTQLRKDASNADSFRSEYNFTLSVCEYFYRHSSQIFDTALRSQLGHHVDLDGLKRLIDNSVSDIRNLFEPNCSFETLKEMTISAAEVDSKADIELLLSCDELHLSAKSGESLRGAAFMCQMEYPLLYFLRFLEQFKFHARLDETFLKIQALASTVFPESPASDISVDFICKGLQELHGILQSEKRPGSCGIDKMVKDLGIQLSLFRLLGSFRKHTEVYVFVKDMKWSGKTGLKKFYDAYNHVTNVLLGNTAETFYMNVLNALEPAVRVLSTVEGESAELCLLSVLRSLGDNADVKKWLENDEYRDLELVQNNLSDIRSWFLDGVDEAAGVCRIFNAVQNGGYYSIISIDGTNDLALALHHTTGSENTREVHKLFGKELDAFIEQVEMIQHEDKAYSDAIEGFLGQYQLLKTAFSAIVENCSVGYDTEDHALFTCLAGANYIGEAREFLSTCQSQSAERDGWLAAIRKSYPSSLLFETEELREIHESLKELNVDTVGGLTCLAAKFAHLGTADPRDAILVQAKDFDIDAASGWLDASSKFVESVHKTLGEPTTVGSKRQDSGKLMIHTIAVTSGDNQRDAELRVLRSIFPDRLPASFEFLDASLPCSDKRMTLFLLRAKQFTSQTFVIVKAEELRGKHLEAVIRFLSNHDNKLLGVRLHCVQCKSSSLQPSAWVESKRWEESALESVASAWKHLIVDGTRVETACIVTSESSGTGKTAWIRMQKRSEGQVGSITIHERSTPDKLADDLMSKFTEEAGEKFVHFSFTYLPKPSSNASSQWLESMNQFFFSLLVLGTIYSHVSSRSLHSYKAKWNIYIELPAGIITDVAIPNWLRVYLPILSLSCELESPPHDFMIDEDTRRVCTYLRAYENGTIDRKYEKRCRKCILFVIDRSGSMGLDAGHGESRLAIATNCALRIFDSHLQDDDIVGVTMFDDLVETVVQTQAIRDEAHKSELRRDMDSMRDQSRNGTYMYLALAAALHSASNSHQEIETWIICLTDGQTADKDATFRPNLQRSCANIHVVLVGVGLQPAYETKMRDLCNKYQPPNRSRTKGFYVSSEANAESMSNAFATVAKGIPVSQTFELDGRVSDDECRRLIRKYAPEFITDDNMQLIEFWIRFLFRRVSVLDANESYNYNEDMEGLGSKLFELMLFEIKRLIGNNHSRDWINNNYSQLIYDFTKPDAPEFRLLCTSPSNLDQETRRKYESMDLPGFNIPNEEQLKEHSTLCWLLSRSMDIPLNGDGRLHCIEEHGFVLTLDFTIKLLNFHERVACKVPCILEGETGVSKTGLTKMYSILRNSSQSARATESTHADLNEIEEEIRGLGFDIGEGNDSLVRLESALQAEAEATIGDSTELAARLRALISHKCAQRSPLFQDQPEKLSNDKTVSVLELLQWFASATLKKTFFEINVDSSMDENAVLEMFKPILRTAKRLSEVGALIVVFFDEINTSSMLGLFKEIVIDRTLSGRALEENILAVAACNPIRLHGPSETQNAREKDLGKCWASGHYQVTELPTSMSQLKWCFGSLNESQEKEFIYRRLEMVTGASIPPGLHLAFTNLVSTSQKAIRSFALKNVTEMVLNGVTDKKEASKIEDAKLRASSTVSLRDIQRVFSLFDFFSKDFSSAISIPVESAPAKREALLLAIGIVYYMRLDSKSRMEFLRLLNDLPGEVTEGKGLKEVLDYAIDTVVKNANVPQGVALTRGLKENLFMTLVCALSRTPLMIVGPPGSSKTLSVNMLADNANGEDSPNEFFRQYARLSLYHYQCSKASTSKEIAAVFSKASQRQEKVDSTKQKCVVFMDEAGLPEEERESLNVLHYLLEGHMSMRAPVAFVAITNHVLDAAKSNRCVTLLRQEPDIRDLITITKGLLFSARKDGVLLTPRVELDEFLFEAQEFAKRLCSVYLSLLHGKLLPEAITFFGLRDFIFFLKALRSYAVTDSSKLLISVKSLVRAIERNFNGISLDAIKELVRFFLESLTSWSSPEIQEKLPGLVRLPMDTITDGLQSGGAISDFMSRDRFKLIIDCTEDDSMMRILNHKGLLDISKKSVFKLSHSPEEVHLEKLRLISGVKFSAMQGNVAVLSQTEAVNESFYDLFNQNFRAVAGSDGEVSLFANIAVGGISRRSLVARGFQCIMQCSESGLEALPAPFLNRFEKFRLDVGDVLEAGLRPLGVFGSVLMKARQQTEYLLTPLLKLRGIFGWAEKQRTLDSIFVGILPAAPLSEEHRTAKGVIAVEDGNTLSEVILKFLNLTSSLSMTPAEIHAIIGNSIHELPVDEGNWIRKYINGVSDPHSIAQALEGTLSEPALDLQVSACLNLLQIIVTHYAVSRLMRLATPEAVFASRNELPIELLDDFFLNRFTSLKHLVGYQLEEQKQIHGTRLAVVYTRTDAAIHCFPSCPIKQNEGDLNHVTREKIVAQVSPFADEVVIERLELLRTESELRNSVVSWAQSTQKHVYVLLVDMDESKAEERVKYIRICAEQYASRTSNKVFLLLLHYPPSRTFQSSYFPAIFLGGWQHYFLDGVGQGGFELDASHALRVACKSGGLLETDDIDKLVDALERFLQEQLQHVLPRIASQQIFSVEQLEASSVGNFTETQSSLQLLLLKKLISRTVGERTIGSILCRKFSMSWVQSELLKTVQQASRGLLEGTTQLSMATSVQSTLIELFEAYLLHTLVTINRNRNADVLDRLPADEGLGELFGYILDGLHVCQREELLLYRDRRLQQRSSMTSHSKIEPRFPFFDLLSSCIEEILEKADIALKGEEEKPVGPRNSLSESNRLFTRVMEMLQEFQDTESEEEGIGNMLHYRGCLVMKVVQRVLVASQGGKAATDSLFQLYLQQFIEYKTSCTPNDVITDWILKQTHAVQAATNIVAVHCVTRCRLTDFMRLSSWTSMVQRQLPSIWEECIQDGSLEEAHGASFLRSFFYKLLNHFESTLIDGCAGNDWSKLLWSFLQQIIGLSPLEFLQDERDMFRIRILALFLILAQSQASRVIQHAALKKFYDSENKAIKVGPREVASLSEIFGSLEGDRSLEDVLFQQYFSQDWAPIMLDYYTEDFGFLVDFITSEKFEGTRGHQRAVALLFRACSAHGSEDQRFLVEGLSTRCLHILSRKITCERISDFSDAGARTSLPHFIPKWLRSERADQVGELTLASCYSTFFSYYSHSFGDDRLAEIVFDMILGILLRQAEESTSEDALLLLTRAIEAESFIDRSTQARRLRSEAHGVLLDSSVGLSLGAMICSARVICFVAKVAQELAESSLPLALSGMNRDVGLYVLQDIMSVAGVQYHSLFFSLIANHHQREGALTDLLGDGVLRDLPWCQSMREGIPSCRTEIARALTDAETALADAVNEENRKVAQFRLCPGCQQPFEVDQANCGQMRCGSDAHGVGGRPAVGGHAVGDTYGCDRLFNLGQARNYVQDEGILKPLREAVEHRRVEMLAFESAESHWRSILSFRIPNLKFSLQKQAAGPDIVPSAYLKGGGCCHEEALDLLSDASRLGDMFSLLPDLIEFYVWLHKSFRYLLSREEAWTLLMKDIMTTEYLLERFGRDPADHILALWSRLKKSFNTFLKGGNRVFWNCTEVNFTYDNLEEAPLITLLSEGPLPTAGDSVDFLFLVIHDLVSKYNSIVERYRVARDQDTDETLSIEPELILPGSGGSVLIRLVPQLSGPELDALAIGAWDSQMQAFDNEYLAGQLHFHLKSDCQSFLPVISSPQSSLREPFVFREDTNDMPTGRSDSGLVFALPGSYYFAREEDLRLIRTAQQMLGALGFSGGNENGIGFILNSTFYNVDSYEKLVSILRGLCSFLECLITQDTIEIKQTVRQTLESLFHQRDKQELLDCVGFPELNSEQCTTLSSLKPNQLASSVDYFAFQLASEGFNFASLDLCMTAPITAEEKATLEERFSRLIVRPNSTRKALEDLDSFVDHTLEFYKNQIRDEALRHGSSLRDFLKTSNFCCEETDPVLGILPRSVTVRNYVPLRQLLQQMRLSLLWHATNVDDEETEETATLRPEKCWLWTDESAKVANNSAMKDTPRSAKETGVAETDTEKFRRLSEYRRNSAATRIQRWWRYNYASLEASRKSRQESSDENHQSTPMVEDDLSSDGASPMLEDDLSSDGGYDMESPDFSRISFEGEEFFDPLEEYTLSKERSSFGQDPNVDFVQSCPPSPESHPDHEEFEDTMQEDPSEWRDVEDEKKSEDGDDGSAVNTFLSDWILDNQLDHSVGEALQRMGVRSLEDIRMVVKVDELLARLQLAPLDEYKLKLAVQSQPASFGQWLWDSFSFFR